MTWPLQELPSERDDAHKVQRSLAFKQLDKDRDGRLTLSDLKWGFTHGDFAQVRPFRCRYTTVT